MEIAGERDTMYYIESVLQSDAGTYQCAVTDACGVLLSHAAELVVRVPCAGCPADFNQDGGVDGFDVEAFFLGWEAGDGCTDLNQDGGIDGTDVEAFFLTWQAGGC